MDAQTKKQSGERSRRKDRGGKTEEPDAHSKLAESTRNAWIVQRILHLMSMRKADFAHVVPNRISAEALKFMYLSFRSLEPRSVAGRAPGAARDAGLRDELDRTEGQVAGLEVQLQLGDEGGAGPDRGRGTWRRTRASAPGEEVNCFWPSRRSSPHPESWAQPELHLLWHGRRRHGATRSPRPHS